MMHRTPWGPPVLDRMAAVNDQLCFFLFAEWEVERSLLRFAPSLNERFSTELFADNPHAPRIHVPLADLRGFQIANRTFALGTYFATSYELLAGYYRPAIDLLARFRPATLTPSSSLKKEIWFSETLASSGAPAIATEIIDTLSYLRLRRNHFVHFGEDVKPEMQELQDKKGDRLNVFWDASVDALNFRDPMLDTFPEDETIELLKLLRIVVEQLDTAVAMGLDTRMVIEAECNAVLDGRTALNDREFARAGKKVEGRLRHNYGYDVDGGRIEESLRNLVE